MSDPRADMETRRGWRLALLHALYERSDGDPAAVFHTVWTIGDDLAIPRDQVWDVAAYLWAENLAEQADAAGGISITHAGVIEVEAALETPARPTARFPAARNVIRIERAVNTVIQQGNLRSTQTVRLEAGAHAEAAELADALAGALDRLDAADTERAELRAQLDALSAQLDAPKPRLGAVRTAATAIRDVLDGLARTGKAARAALPLLQRARTLLGKLGG